MTACLPLALAMLLAVSPAVAAQSGHIIDHWSVTEGLPNNALSGVLQTRDGYLWVATWAGTVRFDGVRFTPIAENLPNHHARFLLEDTDGSIWIGVSGSGLSRWRQGQVELFTPAHGLAGTDPRAIVQDAEGRIWVGTENGLNIVEASGIATLRTADGLPGNLVTSLAVSQDGGVWVATTQGLCRASAPARRCASVGAPVDEQVDAVLEDRDGRLWIGTPRGLIVRGASHPACAGRCLEDVAATALRQTRDGEVWVGTSSGEVARLHDGGIDRFGARHGLPPGSVVDLHEDAEGSLWVATYNGGLSRIKPARVRTFSTAEGLPATAAGSIVQDRHGDIWAGTRCGPVAVLRDGRFVPQWVDELRGACAWVMWPARDGAMWIGTRGHGLYRWTGGRLDHFDAADGLSDLHIASLFEDRDGAIWIGTWLGGLHVFRGGQLSRAFGPADGVATPYIASFAQDRDGRVWIGSNANGLSVYEHGTFRTLPPEESPPTRNIAGLIVDSRGDLWIGSAASGLFRRRNGRYESFGVDQGLGDRLVALMVEDAEANLWVGTARGISRLERDRIEAVASGRAARLDPIILDRADGMRNPEGSGGGHDPSGLRDRDGRLWFSTIDGIVVIDPKSFATNRVVPLVAIEHALLEERPWPWRADGAIEVPAGTTSIELAYTAFSFIAPRKMRFRYRLGGYDTAWHEVGTRRSAFYGRLPPGEYRFEVMASNNDGVWSATPAAAQVVVLPFFWERRPVQLSALALLLVATGIVVHAAGQRRARRRLADLERAHALDRERTRIARDLHDDLGSQLSHIALMAERDGARSGLSGAARKAAESLDELVWAVNARHDTLEGFAAYAARFAEDHVAAAGLRLRVQIAAELPAYELSSETRRHLYLAFKEAITNAVKHARAAEIDVALLVNGATLQLEVADDGGGIQGTGDPTGNGLRNMRERMQTVGGTMEITPRAHGGVRVVFRVPIAVGRVPEAGLPDV